MGKRAPGRGSNQWLGQHFLKSPKLAGSLVDQATVSPSDLVVEVGAGDGMLTNELVRRAAKVLAVEKDRSLAVGLVRRFSNDDKVLVLAGDFFDLPLPAHPFRFFGNIPFDGTTHLLRYLLDATGVAFSRADFIVQRGAAIKRAQRWNLLNLCWAPWWQFSIAARIPSSAFTPRPSVDAALLTICKRTTPLLPEQDTLTFARFARVAWAARDVGTAMKPLIPARRLRTLSTKHRFSLHAPPSELEVQHWIALFRAAVTPE